MRLERSLAFALTLVLALVLAATTFAGPVHKPSAPFWVSLTAQRVDRGFEVTLTAIPTRDVPNVELVLDGEHRRFGATAKGERRELSLRIAIATGKGRDIVGGAIAARRSKAALIRIGTPRATPRRARTTRRLPDGREIEEVR